MGFKKVLDTAAALRIVYLLATPIENTEAFKLGLIDSSGKTIKKATTGEENDATSMLHRLVWNLKRIIGMVPGGSTRIGSLFAAFALMKESVENEWTEEMLSEQTLLRFNTICEDYTVNSETQYNKAMSELIEAILDELDEDAPANATGGGVSTDTPNVKIGEIVKRKKQKSIDLSDATC